MLRMIFTQGRKVAVLDKDAAATVFPSEDPLGKTLEINGEPFTVVGVVDKASSFKPVINTIEDYYQYSGSQMTTVYVPYETWPVIYCYDENSQRGCPGSKYRFHEYSRTKSRGCHQ